MKFNFLFTVLSTLVQGLSNSNAHLLLLSTKNGKSCGSPIQSGTSRSFGTLGGSLNSNFLMSQKPGTFVGHSSMTSQTGECCNFGGFPISQKPQSFVGHDGSFKSCTSNSFTIRQNGNLPEVTVNGFYMPFYGAGRPGPTYFNPNKSYMGFIILAINHKTKWYADPSNPFRRRNYNSVERRSFRSIIKPGYILMQETEYLERHYKSGTRHSKPFEDFTGKSIIQLENEGTFYFGLGFSYQAKNTKTGQLFCDFKDASGTFNGKSVNIPGVGKIEPLQTQSGNIRSTEVAGLIKLAVNHWRETKQRLLPVSTLHEWRKSNTEIKNNLPSCPATQNSRAFKQTQWGNFGFRSKFGRFN